MRSLLKNKQAIYVSRFDREAPEYKRDKSGSIIYEDIDGELIPIETGKKIKIYTAPEKINANIAYTGGIADVQSFGVDLSGYDAILYYDGALDETTYVWYRNEPVMKDGVVDVKSADYLVARVPPVLNEKVYFLKGVG